MTKFISLHNHTDFSILNSLIPPRDLFLKAKELGQSAVGVTDYGSFAGVWDALKASKEIGVKLIIGADFYFIDDLADKNSKLRYIVLLAKNAIGYRNLLLLNGEGFDHSSIIMKRVFPIIDWNLLSKYSEGIICLTGCGNGIIGQLLNNRKFEDAENALKKLIDIFGSNLGAEVQAHNLVRGATYYTDRVEQAFTNGHVIRLAKKYDIKIVPTTDAHYIKREDAEIHDVMLAIGSMQPVYSNARIKYDVSDLYLKSGDEVKSFFARNNGEDFADKICENTIYFADMCEAPQWIDPKYSNPTGKELPIFPIEKEEDYSEFLNWLSRQPEPVIKLDKDKSYLRYKCFKTFSSKVPGARTHEYKARLQEEFDVIEHHGFSSYMLIVADYINWARQNNIRVGAGRGSVAGSLIAYLLNIHMADPIKYKLIFARFHNKEKSSFPDIDTDFSPAGRDRVQKYIRDKYGADHVAHVSNISTITPKVYARDISRACELGGDRQLAVKLGNDIADSIPKKVDEKEIKTFQEAVNKSPLFVEYIKRYPQLEKYSSICGKFRAWATHAAGLVISRRPLPGFIPLRKDKDGSLSIEFDKERAEENGLVKMDTLGLETLDIIDETYRLIKEAGKPAPPDPPNFDEYDKETYDLISRGDTFCVFQLGTSAGTIDLCKKVKAKSIEDISHINALARPSARDIRDGFIAAKEGKKKVQLLHPSLKRAFGDTFGFGLYEESLMYLAQDVAGWSLHEADRLRKLTKEKGKNPKKALQWRSDFIADGKKNNNISEDINIKIWDEVVDKFQGYGFNMSHSITYSMISYHTAYLKAHYPVEFLLANLMSEIKSNVKVANENIERIKQELKYNGVKLVPPDINRSQLTYKILEDGTLLTGLDALKFVGDDAIQDIIRKRPFANFHEFMLKVDTMKVRSTTIQALAASGCLDSFGISRKLIYLYCSDYRKKLQVWLKKHNPNTEKFEYPWPVVKDWSLPELYALEKSYLGEAFVCGKKDAYMNFFKHKSALVQDIRKMKNRDVIPSIRAEVKSIFEFKVKKETSKYFGEHMIKATIEDEIGEQITLTVFSNKWKEVKTRMKELYNGKYKFEENIAIHFSGTVNVYENEIGIILENFYDICPPPPLPKDLKARKVSIKKSTHSDDIKLLDINSTDKLIENLEDELFNAGFIDLDEENDD